MQIFSDDPGSNGPIQNLFIDLRRLIGVWRKMNDIDAPRLRQLFEDHNLIGRHPIMPGVGSNGQSTSLTRLMDLLGLDHHLVRRRHPELMQDLERNCTNCRAVVRCEDEIRRGTAQSALEQYCTNAVRLVKLRQEDLRSA